MAFEGQHVQDFDDNVVNHLQGQVEQLANLVSSLQAQIQAQPIQATLPVTGNVETSSPMPGIPQHVRDLGRTFQKPP